MILDPVFLNTKNNINIELRSPAKDEAQSILTAMIEISADSPYILSTPDTFRHKTVENQIQWIENSRKSPTSITIAAYHNQKVIGLCNGQSYSDIKRKHRAALGISIHQDFRGQGLGKKMMEVLIENMKKFSGIKIIELDVMLINKNALKMYESLGFQKVGIFPKAFVLLSGEISDNLTMYMEV